METLFKGWELIRSTKISGPTPVSWHHDLHLKNLDFCCTLKSNLTSLLEESLLGPQIRKQFGSVAVVMLIGWKVHSTVPGMHLFT